MWVVKAKGETYYVQHVDCSVPWSTKETPENSHTKGSIKINNCLVTIDEDNNASIKSLTIFDKIRLRNAKRGTRVILSRWINDFKDNLKLLNIKHGPIKRIGGACSTTFYVCDIFDKEAVFLLQLALKKNSDMRILMPNESYYKMYDDTDGEHMKVDYNHPDTPYEYS
jgi:hypothetical protein